MLLNICNSKTKKVLAAAIFASLLQGTVIASPVFAEAVATSETAVTQETTTPETTVTQETNVTQQTTVEQEPRQRESSAAADMPASLNGILHPENLSMRLRMDKS